MTNPNNLVTKLFKAKCFPHNDFLESNVGHNPSFVWRNIWNAKSVVHSGYMWNIGSCHNILWEQNWLGDSTCLRKPNDIHPDLEYLTISVVVITSEENYYQI